MLLPVGSLERNVLKDLYRRTFELFDETFADDKNTIVVIDEIQESAEVYSMIRQFARDFSCHFVVYWKLSWKNIEQGIFFASGGY